MSHHQGLGGSSHHHSGKGPAGEWDRHLLRARCQNQLPGPQLLGPSLPVDSKCSVRKDRPDKGIREEFNFGVPDAFDQLDAFGILLAFGLQFLQSKRIRDLLVELAARSG